MKTIPANPSPKPTPEEYAAAIARRIGAELRERREARRISAYALAKHAQDAQQAQVSDQTILNIEQGLTSPTVKSLALLCVYFGTTLEEFVVAAALRPDCPKRLG